MLPPGFTMDGLLQVVTNVGLPGIILLMYYLDQRAMQKVLTQYRSDMVEQRRMYETNVELVKRYCSLAESQQVLNSELKDIVLMNTRALTELVDSIKANQYCPQVRLNKFSKGFQE